MASFAVSKGKRGEREVCDELQPTVDSVAKALGMSAPRVRRNLQQSGDGGEDILGLPWYAIEVKRCETLALDRWWQQCVTQARRKAAMASAWDDLSRGGWRRLGAAEGRQAGEAAAVAPREALEARGGALAALPWLGGGEAAVEDAGDPLAAPGGSWRDLGGERVPVLVWRVSRRPWQVRTRVQASTVGGGLLGLDVDLPLSAWLDWLALDLRGRLQALTGS